MTTKLSRRKTISISPSRGAGGSPVKHLTKELQPRSQNLWSLLQRNCGGAFGFFSFTPYGLDFKLGFTGLHTWTGSSGCWFHGVRHCRLGSDSIRSISPRRLNRHNVHFLGIGFLVFMRRERAITAIACRRFVYSREFLTWANSGERRQFAKHSGKTLSPRDVAMLCDVRVTRTASKIALEENSNSEITTDYQPMAAITLFVSFLSRVQHRPTTQNAWRFKYVKLNMLNICRAVW